MTSGAVAENALGENCSNGKTRQRHDRLRGWKGQLHADRSSACFPPTVCRREPGVVAAEISFCDFCERLVTGVQQREEED